MVRRALVVPSLIAVCITFLSCGDQTANPDPRTSFPKGGENPGQIRFSDGSTCNRQAIVEADNTFGLALFRQATQDEPDINLVISPLSVSIALGMTVNGAEAATLRDMKSVLNLTGYSIQEVNRRYRDLIRLLLGLDPSVELVLANSIWCREGPPYKQDFLDVCSRYFDAQVTSLDFSDPDASRIINTWVSDKTGGRITGIVDRRIDPLIMMFLINAVYFKGEWLHAFDSDETFDGSFILPDGTHSPCRMMCQPETTDFYTLLSAPEFDALDMPYGDSLFSMTVLLPHEGTAPATIIRDLTPSNWSKWVQDFTPWSGRVVFPRFEVEYELTMNDVLTDMGMGIIFDPARADFTRICDVFDEFFVHKVKHKTYVRVDEIGTEAAAVTSVEMGPTSSPNHFWVNRPFIFVIRENRFNTILFIGRITDPGCLTD